VINGQTVIVKKLVIEVPNHDADVIDSVFMHPPGYIHPEIFNTMLYQTGCTMMNLFTGVPPFYFDTAEIYKQKIEDHVPVFDFTRYECWEMTEVAISLVKQVFKLRVMEQLIGDSIMDHPFINRHDEGEKY
jgi:hypothetical protein